MNENGFFSKSNGVPKDILEEQASALNLPIVLFSTTWVDYEKNIIEALSSAGEKFNAEICVFGDIDIEPHKKFEEDVCNKANLKAVLPLWGEKREDLAHKIINSGLKAKISVIRSDILPDSFLGIDYCAKTIINLQKLNVDLCGENGEFHTLVYDSPLFSRSISVPQGEPYVIMNYKLCNYQSKDVALSPQIICHTP